jgi:hypothetical protein
MVDIQTSEADAKLAPVNMGWNFVCWYNFEGWTTFSKAILVKTKNTNLEGGWMLKFTLCFMETIHKPLVLEKWSLVQHKKIDICTSSIWITILFDEAFKCDGAKFWRYVGTHAESLCLEFCNFVHCHILVNYLTVCLSACPPPPY